jgi:hypothetical protein
MILKNGLYYILDINNKESLKYLANVILDLRIKYAPILTKQWVTQLEKLTNQDLLERGNEISTTHKKI